MADTPEGLRRLTLTVDSQNDEIIISVADHGCGLSPAVRERLFTAFFTTKADGMGVGLSICRSFPQTPI